jgi:hypothetical protein
VATNGTTLSLARVDKYFMVQSQLQPNREPIYSMRSESQNVLSQAEAVRSAKVRAVQQARASKWEDVERFLQRLYPASASAALAPLASENWSSSSPGPSSKEHDNNPRFRVVLKPLQRCVRRLRALL